MAYKENPKTRGSGIICAIPQTGECPNHCADCFFQSGRSYLEPLNENLPNMPPVEAAQYRVVRVNDGNDSNVNRDYVMERCKQYPLKFYNTSLPFDLGAFDAPVVLTVNPGAQTDETFNTLGSIPRNLMFVRFRVNTWNLDLCDMAVGYYSARNIPIVLTFMAYFTGDIKKGYEDDYILRKRTLNEYRAITTTAWERVMGRYRHNKWVYSCGKIEGERGTTACRHCGNCLREFFACRENMATCGSAG
jgi:hypothetical protein